LLLAGTAGSGCSSGGSAAGGVPTAGNAPHSSTTTPSGNPDQALIDYVHCMRARGVTISDPSARPGHTGLSLNPPSMSVPGVVQADRQCQHLLAPLIAAKTAGARAQITPTVMNALLRYARCMRRHNIGLLDPDPSDGHISMGNVAGINNNVGRQDPLFHDADAACRHLLPSTVPDDGTGPP